jgi:predicted RecB family endonuclease
VALTDILSDAGNVSAIIEVFTLFFIVAGFFRWYDSKYQKTIVTTKDEVVSSIQDLKETLCGRIERMDQEIMRIEDRLHKHMSSDHNWNSERDESY